MLSCPEKNFTLTFCNCLIPVQINFWNKPTTPKSTLLKAVYIQVWNTIKLSRGMKNSQLQCWKKSYRYGLRLIYLSVSPVLWHAYQRVFLFCCTIAHARQGLSASAWARFLSPILKPKSRGIVLPSHLTVFYLHSKWLGSQVTLRNPKWLHLLISRHLGSLW